MDRSQWYIGAVNGAVVCADCRKEGNIEGRLYHSYSRESEKFSCIEEVIFNLEELFDDLGFPYPTTRERSFWKGNRQKNQGEKRKRIMSDETLLSKHGELGTFIIRVQHRQNSSWQGRLTWMERNETVCFRSIWEMVKLMESALDMAGGSEEDKEKTAGWSDI